MSDKLEDTAEREPLRVYASPEPPEETSSDARASGSRTAERVAAVKDANDRISWLLSQVEQAEDIAHADVVAVSQAPDPVPASAPLSVSVPSIEVDDLPDQEVEELAEAPDADNPPLGDRETPAEVPITSAVPVVAPRRVAHDEVLAELDRRNRLDASTGAVRLAAQRARQNEGFFATVGAAVAKMLHLD